MGCMDPQVTLSPDERYIVSFGFIWGDPKYRGLLIIFDLETKQFLNNTPIINGDYSRLESMRFIEGGKYLMIVDDRISFWQFNPPDDISFVYSINFTGDINHVNIIDSCIAIGLYSSNSLIFTQIVNGTQLKNSTPISIHSASMVVSPVNDSLLYITTYNGLVVYEFDRENCILGSAIQRYDHSRFLFCPDYTCIYLFWDVMIEMAHIRQDGLFELPPYYSLNVSKTYQNSIRDNEHCYYHYRSYNTVIDPQSRYMVSSADRIGQITFFTLEQNKKVYRVDSNTRENECVIFYNSEVLIISEGNQVLANILQLGPRWGTTGLVIYDVNPYVLYQEPVKSCTLWKGLGITFIAVFALLCLIIITGAAVYTMRKSYSKDYNEISNL